MPQPGRACTPEPAAEPPRVAPGRDPWRRGRAAAELVAVFALGVTLMTFIYQDPRGIPADQIGVPGYDAWYHTKMAALLPDIGFVRDYPWLRHVYFSQLDAEFISHHAGFHVLLAPFVKLSYWLTGDYVPGGRWAIATFFGLALALVQGLLMQHGVRWRWLWLVVFLLLPAEFFSRHSFVRAICPSLVFMLAILLLMFRDRYVLAGLATAGYVHLYLGSVVYAPLIVATYTLCSLLGRRGERDLPWRLVLWTSFGWLLGLRTYPYFDGALEFLRMQVLGTGLDPDIEVGAEWSSYANVWHFAVQMCGPMLAVWAAALVLRLRLGERLNPRELTLVVLNFTFLFLTFKAKRFIEYWPPFCLLSAAYMAGPVLAPLAVRLAPSGASVRTAGAALWRLLPAIAAGGVGLALIYFCWPHGLGPFVAWWPAWVILAAALTLPELLAVWGGGRTNGASRAARWIGSCAVLSTAVAVCAGTVLLCAGRLVAFQRDVYCGYDLPAIREAMDYLQDVSHPGDVVFTDDWDVFPVFFYHNHHNHYIVGLDPKFTHHREPVLWERYVKITRGQTPRTFEASWTGPNGAREHREIQARIEDIRDYFGARYVVVDSDHTPLARNLIKVPDFAELVYPKSKYDDCVNAPYLIFKVHDVGASRRADNLASQEAPLFLSDLTPITVSQGWGELTRDRSVSDRPIQLGDTFYPRGLGTHAPLELVYEIPAGYETFAATVGVNRSTEKRGSVVVSVDVDGREVYRSPILSGESEPIHIRLGVTGAKRLTLRAFATPDGNRWDHVDWAMARFLPSR